MPRLNPARWPWPSPAVLAWLLCWWVLGVLRAQGVALPLALAGATAVGVACTLWGSTGWRRVWIAAGFPLSVVAGWWTWGADTPASWTWLLPLLVLLGVYPVHAWRDAPLFPTPPDALRDVPQHVPLPVGAHVLDAGCGLGHGLQALRQAYPQVELHGIEWSWLLRLACGLRCSWARVVRADMWAAPWSGYDMVYLFQRPESMARAADKVRAELRPGAWLVSLEFAVPQVPATAQCRTPGGKMVWLYRAPLPPQSGESP